MPPKQTNANLADITTAFPVLPEPPDTAARWQGLVVQHTVVGKQAHDARLAALMIAHGVAHILTFNPGDFARYEAITEVSPHEVH